MESLWNTLVSNELYLVLAIFAVAIWFCSVITTIYRYNKEDYIRWDWPSCNADKFRRRMGKSFFTSIALFIGVAVVIFSAYSSCFGCS